MKDTRSEQLHRHLMNADENILENAYAIDDAEKLGYYTQMKNARLKRKPAIAKYSLIAACLVLIVAALICVPALLDSDDGYFWEDDEDESAWPFENFGDEYVTINSLDALNYYSAVKIFSEESENAGLLASRSIEVKNCAYNEKNIAKATKDSDEENIYYYEIDPDEIFSVTQVVMFRIKVTDKNCFLADKVGLGIVDVVITDNNLEPMITFKNGGRFYSCLQNGCGPNDQNFSTHKYVEGFCIVKNLEEEITSFYVEFDRKHRVTSFESVSHASVQYTNSEHDVLGESFVCDGGWDFKISDLEKYYNANKPVETPDNGIASVCVSGEYKFELYKDKTFIFTYNDGDFAVYQKGEYIFDDDKVTLIFLSTDGNTVIERVECELLEGDENGFIYMGEKFIAQEPTGG